MEDRQDLPVRRRVHQCSMNEEEKGLSVEAGQSAALRGQGKLAQERSGLRTKVNFETVAPAELQRISWRRREGHNLAAETRLPGGCRGRAQRPSGSD